MTILKDLIKKCAKGMDDEDARRIQAGETHFKSVAGEWTWTGRAICEKICAEEGWPNLATPVYLMLGGAWNDALAWAEES